MNLCGMSIGTETIESAILRDKHLNLATSPVSATPTPSTARCRWPSSRWPRQTCASGSSTSRVLPPWFSRRW